MSFQQKFIDFEDNIYNELESAQILEDIGYGRNVGNVFLSDNDYVPIVRTTTKYTTASTSKCRSK